MTGKTTCTFIAVAVAAVLAASAALAQQAVRIRGPIEAVEGSTFTVKADEAGTVKVKLGEKARVFGVVNAKLEDVNAGDFVGVGATPQADGSQRAIQVTIFAETLRAGGHAVTATNMRSLHERFGMMFLSIRPESTWTAPRV